MCGDCNGQGGDRQTCQHCHGNGFITQRIGTGMFVQMVQSHCNACNGQGYSYTRVCHTCNGATTQDKIETLSVKLPHNVDDGQFLKLQGKGDYRNGIYGNLILRVRVTPENDFEKFGDDLIYNKYFDLDGLKTESFEVPHPNGPLAIKMPPTFDTSKPLRVKSKGFNNGDLFIKLFVRFTR
jgi:molecular chaperone DnaJ